MKTIYVIVLFLSIVLLDANGQIIIPADTTVCGGTTLVVSASVDSLLPDSTYYTVDTIPFAPEPFTNGVSVSPNLSDDQFFGPFNIGFEFSFYDSVYTQFYVGTNGWMGFEPTPNSNYDSWRIDTIPSLFNDVGSPIPRSCIMPCWRDWHTGTALNPFITYKQLGVAPFRRLVVEWSTTLYGCSNNLGYFQAVIYESTNIIDNHLINVPFCMVWPPVGAGMPGGGVQAIQNTDASKYVVVPGRNDTPWAAYNESWRFSPQGLGPNTAINWLDANMQLIADTALLSQVMNGSTTLYCELTTWASTYIDSLNVEVWSYDTLLQEINEMKCYGDEALATVLVDNAMGAVFFDYSWYDVNGVQLSSAQSANSYDEILISEPGLYYANVTDSLSCNSLQMIFNIIEPDSLHSNPVITDVQSATLPGEINPQISGGTPPYDYLWSTGETVTLLQVPLAGSYSLTLVDANNCVFTEDYLVEGYSNVQEQEVQLVGLYPNPINDLLNVNLLNAGVLHYSIYSCDGKLLLAAEINHAGETYQLDFGQFQSGVYYLHLMSNKQSAVRKIVKR